jgi:hypothetical protein
MSLPSKSAVDATTTLAELDALFLANNVNCTGAMTGSKRCTDCADCTGCTDCVGCIGCVNCTGCSYLTNCTDCVGCDGTATAQSINLLRCTNVDKSDDCTDCADISNSRYCVRCFGEPLVTAQGNKYAHLWRCSYLKQCNACAYLNGTASQSLSGQSVVVGAISNYNQAGYTTNVWAKTGRGW